MESNTDNKTKSSKYYKYYKPLEPLMAKSQNRVYTAAIFSFFAISLFGWYAIRPTINTILLLRKEITEKKEINKKMEKKISDLIEAQSNFQQIESQLYLLDQAIPKNPDIFNLDTQIEKIIVQTEATASSISLGNNVPLVNIESKMNKKLKKGDSEFDMGLEIQGEYINIENVLALINNMRRIVTSLNFTIGEAKKNTTESLNAGWLNIALRIKSYYQ